MTDLSPETVGTTPPDDPRADEGLVEAMAKAMCAQDSDDFGVLFAIHWQEFGEGHLRGAQAALTAARSHGGM